MLYSQTTGGFYDQAIHGNNIPADAVAITVERHAELMAGQALGKVIHPDANGAPQLVEPDDLLTLAEIKDKKLTELAAYRSARETAGITINGTLIRTDDKSQAKITGAWGTAQMNPSVIIRWKGVNGWIGIGKTEIDAIAMAVSAHVEACFAQEEAHSNAILALTTKEDIAAYDYTTGWPE